MHHSCESRNPENIFNLRNLLDSSFRWNDAPLAHFLDSRFYWNDVPLAYFLDSSFRWNEEPLAHFLDSRFRGNDSREAHRKSIFELSDRLCHTPIRGGFQIPL